jgi:hypothetical protein
VLNNDDFAANARARRDRTGIEFLAGALVAFTLLVVSGVGVVARPAAVATPVVASPVAEGQTGTVAVYFLRPFERGEDIPPFDVLAAASRDSIPVSSPEADSEAVLSALVAGPNTAEREAGLTTSLPADLDVAVLAVADGVVTVELPAALLAGDPEVNLSRQMAQIVFTLTALPGIDHVRFRIADGVPEAAATATVPSEAVDRDDFAYQTPPILVESPTIGAVVSNPVNVRGTANTVEGSFVVRIEQTGDGQEVILAETLVQTSGSGTRGPFDVTLDLPANASGPARLVTYQISRSAAGEAIDRVEIPIDLGP